MKGRSTNTHVPGLPPATARIDDTMVHTQFFLRRTGPGDDKFGASLDPCSTTPTGTLSPRLRHVFRASQLVAPSGEGGGIWRC